MAEINVPADLKSRRSRKRLGTSRLINMYRKDKRQAFRPRKRHLAGAIGGTAFVVPIGRIHQSQGHSSPSAAEYVSTCPL